MIFAVDFDGTIVEHKFPLIGQEFPEAIRVMKALQERGNKIIIWTCRSGKQLDEAVNWLIERGFCPDAVNMNVPEYYHLESPKIYADFYLDDRSFPAFPGWEKVEEFFITCKYSHRQI